MKSLLWLGIAAVGLGLLGSATAAPAKKGSSASKPADKKRPTTTKTSKSKRPPVKRPSTKPPKKTTTKPPKKTTTKPPKKTTTKPPKKTTTKPPKKTPKQSQRRTVKGSQILSRSKMRSLKNGTHRVSSSHGHTVHATLRNGKLAGMHLKNGKGQLVQGRKVRQRGTAALWPESDLHRVGGDGKADVLTLADDGSSGNLVAVQGGFQIAFIFVIQFNDQTIYLIFVFPTCDVEGEAGEDDQDTTQQTIFGHDQPLLTNRGTDRIL